MSHPQPQYHHSHHAHPPKKSTASEFPPSNLQEKVVGLAKVNLGIAIVPVAILFFIILLFRFQSEFVADYARRNNATFVGGLISRYLSQEEQTQWSDLLIQFGWGCVETGLAYVLLHGAKKRDYGYMKAWLVLMTASFIAEVWMQGLIMTRINLSEIPILLMVTFGMTDVYRFCCLFIVYLLIDEMLERGEVARDRSINYELDD